MDKISRLIFSVIAALVLSSCASRTPTRAPMEVLEPVRGIAESPGDPVRSLAFADAQRSLAAGHESGRIEILDVARGTATARFAAHGARVSWVHLTPDGRLGFSGSPFEEDMTLWDPGSGATIHTIAGARGPIIETSHARYFVVTNAGTNARVEIFDLHRKALLSAGAQSSGVVTSVAAHPASGLLAWGTASGTIETWRFSVDGGVPGLHPVAKASAHEAGDWIQGLAFSPDGGRLHSVSRSGEVREWRSGSLTCTRREASALALVESASFLEAGRLLALSGLADDGTPLGEQLIELRSIDGGASRLYAASGNGPVVRFARALSALIVAGDAIAVLPVDEVATAARNPAFRLP